MHSLSQHLCLRRGAQPGHREPWQLCHTKAETQPGARARQITEHETCRWLTPPEIFFFYRGMLFFFNFPFPPQLSSEQYPRIIPALQLIGVQLPATQLILARWHFSWFRWTPAGAKPDRRPWRCPSPRGGRGGAGEGVWPRCCLPSAGTDSACLRLVRGLACLIKLWPLGFHHNTVSSFISQGFIGTVTHSSYNVS